MEIINAQTGESFTLKTKGLTTETSKSTKTIYVRKGFLNGTLFLSEKGNGVTGAGDIAKLTERAIEVNPNLFDRLYIFANKNK